MSPTVVAVVVTYRPDLALTVPLLRALADQCAHVVVVDNGSAQDARDGLAAVCAEVGAELLPLGHNAGIARAQNVGTDRARELGADLVLFSDQDSLPAPDMVSRLRDGWARAASRGVRVGAVGPVSSDTRSTTEQMVYVARRWGPRRARPEEAHDGLVEAAFLIASGCLIDVAALDEVGGMNEAWFIDHVDLEWGLRARRAGLRLYAVPDAHLDHELGDRLTKLPGRAQEVHVHSPVRTYYLARNTVLLIRSGLMTPAWRLGYAVWLAKYVAFNALLAAPRRRRIALMARGLRDGVTGRTGPLA
ncbi:glycosyltransferase family 2 protein [Georgenia yuyongxinii]|uniref:Glycosyltransferase family 2 protein n=1 Tax=Georgenia yuyongxinii TaxID=2589797 RepID=A0A552WLH0_9MICO|nr:glycosyltransferase family 2 protein [Georgenia yuyongxinii]TRW43597.1 glycosyltransferase family 2 protein [Georgenia yuyongxinii]